MCVFFSVKQATNKKVVKADAYVAGQYSMRFSNLFSRIRYIFEKMMGQLFLGQRVMSLGLKD